jgi:uncharacterized protein (DUF2164 family)
MKRIEFTREETKVIVGHLQGYFRDELDQSLGELPAQLLLDFIADKIGPAFYNRALYDAQAVVSAKADDMSEAILGLERGG